MEKTVGRRAEKLGIRPTAQSSVGGGGVGAGHSPAVQMLSALTPADVIC